MSETTIEPTLQSSMEDLHEFYAYFNDYDKRKADLEEEKKNQHLMSTKDLLSVPISPRSLDNQLFCTDPEESTDHNLLRS